MNKNKKAEEEYRRRRLPISDGLTLPPLVQIALNQEARLLRQTQAALAREEVQRMRRLTKDQRVASNKLGELQRRLREAQARSLTARSKIRPVKTEEKRRGAAAE